jgi:hypothetical protein
LYCIDSRAGSSAVKGAFAVFTTSAVSGIDLSSWLSLTNDTVSFVVLRHLLCKNLISRILKNFYLLWKQIAKERKFLISSSCPGDDGEPKYFIPSEG